MPLSEKLYIPPYAEPIHLDEMKLHLRIDVTADDTLITNQIRTARAFAETFTQRQLVAATWKLSLDEFPYDCSDRSEIDYYGRYAIRTGHAPLLGVKSIQYVDTNGATQTLATSVYTVDKNTEPGRIVLAYNQVWPPTRPQINAVTVTYYAGFVVPYDASAVADRATLRMGDFVSDNPFAVNDIVRVSNTGGTVPAGLATYTNFGIATVINNTATFNDSSGDPVNITDAGTGTQFIGEIPEPIRQAMKLVCGDLYANRENAIEKVSGPIMTAAKRLLWPYRVMEMA